MKAHPDSTPTVDEDSVSSLSVGDTLAIRNEEDITEMTLIMGVKRLSETVTRITVLRADLTWQDTRLHKYELVRTGS